MSNHGGLPVPDPGNKRLPNQTFWGWLKTETALYIGQAVTILGIVLYIGTFSYYVLGHSTHKESFKEYLNIANNILSYANIAVCILFILVLIFILEKNDVGIYHVKESYKCIFKGPEPAKSLIEKGVKSLKRLKLSLIHYWAFAIIYYLFRLLGLDDDNPVKFFVSLCLNTYGAFVIYLCLRILILSNENKYPFGRPERFSWLNWKVGLSVYLLFVLTSFFILFFTDTLSGDYTTGQSKSDIIHTILDTISGIINMILIALFIGRLDSKFIGISSMLIGLIYGYAILQSLYALFKASVEIESIAYLLAFVFKIYFFIVIIYAAQTGRMLNFFCCNGELNKRLTENKQSYKEQE